MKTNLLINASCVHPTHAKTYEFVLTGTHFTIAHCYYVKNQANMSIESLGDPQTQLQDQLFEVNHFRLDPFSDAPAILKDFQHHLLAQGLIIPQEVSCHAQCWSWLESVDLRFQLSDGSLSFMSPSHPALFQSYCIDEKKSA